MTRCVACDKNMTDFEATRKADLGGGKYYYPDLCNKCFKSSELEELSSIVEREDLKHEEDVSNDSDEELLWDRVTWSDEEDE